MQKTMSGVLIEAVVRTALKNLKEDPERGIRNLVDMALQFSDSPFQRDFFQAAQTILQNENSPYYTMVRDLLSYADTDRLLRFGMNVGYNSCISGARQLRDSERRLGVHLPWTVMLQMDAQSVQRLSQYSAAISEGEELGIHTWMLSAPVVIEPVLSLVQAHPDSAFFLFCGAGDISPEIQDSLAELKNSMPVLRWPEEPGETYAALRVQGVPCCTYYIYGPEDLAAIRGGDLFLDVQEAQPVFTALVPRRGCPEAVRCQVQQAVELARNSQFYRTIPWELERDSQRAQRSISEDVGFVCFDPMGRLLDGNGSPIESAASFLPSA